MALPNTSWGAESPGSTAWSGESLATAPGWGDESLPGESYKLITDDGFWIITDDGDPLITDESTGTVWTDE